MPADLTPADPIAAPAGRWHTPRLVRASFALHVGAGVAAVAVPPVWPWALGAVAANHLLLTGTALWPRSNWLGPNLTHLPPDATRRGEIALTFDDGPDPQVTPAVLDLLDEHRARATFFCIAERAAAHPALCREIVRRGHSVQNHSRRHPLGFSVLGWRGLEREVGDAQQLLSDITGERPRFFRVPAGMRSPLLAPVLDRFELALVSWTRRGYDTREARAQTVLARLTRSLDAGDILLLHDGNSARRDGRPVVLDVLPTLLQRIGAHGLRLVTLTQATPLAP